MIGVHVVVKVCMYIYVRTLTIRKAVLHMTSLGLILTMTSLGEHA